MNGWANKESSEVLGIFKIRHRKGKAVCRHKSSGGLFHTGDILATKLEMKE